MAKIAAIRIRGSIGLDAGKLKTFELLGLKAVHNCIVVEDTPQNKGMIKKVEGYVTFGEIDEETFVKLVSSRAAVSEDRLKELKAKSLEELAKAVYSGKSDFKIQKTFKLHAPTGGWGRAGIKKAIKQGGALGYRGADINALIARML